MRRRSKYISVFILSLQNSLQYRMNFFLILLSMVFQIIVQYSLWTVIYRNTGQAVVFGYSYGQMIAYTLLAGLVSKMVSADSLFEVSSDIKNGQLNKFIVQPIQYYLFRFYRFIGERMVQIFVMLLITAGIVAALNQGTGMAIEPERVWIFLIVILLAVILNFLIMYTMNLAAFWITEIWGVLGTFSVLASIASGSFLPLEVFGKPLQLLLAVLPFRYVVSYPINVINGRFSYQEILFSGLVQIGWILLLLLFSGILWRRGMKRYVAIGG